MFTAAAELAAKKSRLKQSLVKRARSVAIFSLKLKEQRAKRAEKAAQEARVITLSYFNHNPALELNAFTLLGSSSSAAPWW